jgi:hypothetical protein
MNINVTSFRGIYDAFDLGDGRVGAPLDPIPQFMSMRLDRAQLRNVNAHAGGAVYRRALGPTVFATTWAFVDHVVVPPGSSIGAHSYRGLAQFYYVMAGEGTFAVSARGQQDSATARTGDAVPIQMGRFIRWKMREPSHWN